MWQRLERLIGNWPVPDGVTAATRTVTVRRGNKYDPGEMARKTEELRYKREKAHVSGERFFYWLRNSWGMLLALTLFASVAFQFWLAYNIGKGRLDFREYKTFLSIVAGESFAQVVGLCLVVVRYLFPRNGK